MATLSKRVVAVLFLALIVFTAESLFWRRRRRRRPPPPTPPPPINCVVGSWADWGSCDVTCGLGTSKRLRPKIVSEANGGVCNDPLSQTQTCYGGQCCVVDCQVSLWTDWSTCAGCGKSLRHRNRTIITKDDCGGKPCPHLLETEKCDTGVCCPVDCQVGNWGSWSACVGFCGDSGKRTRQQTIQYPAKCNGTACSVKTEQETCIMPCCPVDCEVGDWGDWSACSTTCGTGFQIRQRSVTKKKACNGQECDQLIEQKQCVIGTQQDCQVSQWSSYGACQPNDGVCGAGKQTRTRTITVSPQCGGAQCPALSESKDSNCGCCPSNCKLSKWGQWSTCSATCGSGIQSRNRKVTVAESCGGTCGSLQEIRTCDNAPPVSCVVSAWSAWSACSNVCGKGIQIRSRTVTKSAVCGGSCYSLSETQDCTDYSSDQDCVVSWGQWGGCSSKCSVGTRVRTATVTKPKICNGKDCPTLTETESCGQANGGCDHVCKDGTCSCHTGYTLSGKTCTARSCGTPSSKYCPSGTTYNADCLYPTYACSSTTYQSTCTVSCKSGYELKNGPTAILCQSSGAWTPHSTIYCSRINQPPSSITLSSTSFSENTKSGTVIATLSTSDPNPSDTHTYDLLGNAGGKFALQGSSVIVKFVADYETPPTKYEIKVRSRDPKGLYVDKKFTVTVSDVNESPSSITPSVFSIDENSAKGTEVGTLTATDPESQQTHTYRLIDSADNRFYLDGNKLKVAVDNSKCLSDGGSNCLLNYETARSHRVVVRVTDNGSPAKSADFTLTVKLRDINDKPVGLALSSYTVKESAGQGTVIGTLSVVEEDPGQTITYALSSNPGNLFTIDGTSLKTADNSLDYETTTNHKVTVVAKDSGKPRLSTAATFTIEVLAVNEAPVAIAITDSGGQLTFSNNKPRIRENSVKNTKVGTLEVYDEDANEQLTLKLDDDAGKKFALSTTRPRCVAFQGSNAKTKCEASLLVIANLDFEQDSSHTVVVRATDKNGLFKTARFQITVVNDNEQPRSVSVIGGQLSVKENLNDAIVGEIVTDDEDAGDKHSYSLVNSASGKFTISGNKLMTSASADLNFELATQYKIIIRSTDRGGRSLDQTFTVMVEDVNEAPSAVALTHSKVPENSGTGTVVGTLQAKDPDNVKTNRQSFAYVLLDGAQSRFKIEKNAVKVAVDQTLCLKYGGANCKLNYETRRSYNITVQVTDTGSPPLSKTFNITITLTDANDTPRGLRIDKFKVNENATAGTFIGTLSASDEDVSQNLAYAIVSKGGLFYIKGNRLFKSQSIDYETTKAHVITVKVSDNGNPQLSMSKNITIEVLNTNEAPLLPTIKDKDGGRKFNQDYPVVNEAWPLGTVVGTVEVGDPDYRDTVTFSLEKDGNGRFSLRQSTASCKPVTLKGVKTVCSVQLVVAGNLDYESVIQHTIVVKATDNGGLATSEQFSVKVADVNEPPTDISVAEGVAEVEENKNGVTVATLITSDPDAKQTFTYTIVDASVGPFEIVGNLLKVTKTGKVDYESQSSYTLKIKSTDSGHPSQNFTKKIVVRVVDVNEPPTDIALTPQQIPENEGTGTTIGVVKVSDPEKFQSHTCTLLDDADGRFAINGLTVEVSPSNASCVQVGGANCLLNYEVDRSHSIQIRCTDEGNPPQFKDKTFTITVQNRNDPPRNLTLNATKIDETAAVGQTVAAVTAEDEDIGQKLSYKLVDDSNGFFALKESRLVVNKKLDHEQKKNFKITVQVTDSGAKPLSMTQSFFIEVINVNESPIDVTFFDTNGQLSFSANSPVVQENSVAGTVVGTIEARDPDNTETITFSLTDNANGLFNTSKSQGSCKAVSEIKGVKTACRVQLLVSGKLNYELKSQHDIVLSVTDSGGKSRLANFTIKVQDVNDPSTDMMLASGHPEVTENQMAAVVGELVTTDEDRNQKFTYVLVSDGGGPFEIVGRVVRLKTGSSVDYEKDKQFTIRVTSTDNSSPQTSFQKTFVVKVIDVNEPPSSVSLSKYTVVENSGFPTQIGTLSVQDPDNAQHKRQSHTFRLINDAGGRFEIYNFAIRVKRSNAQCLKSGGDSCVLNYEEAKSHVVVVEVQDSGNPPIKKEFPLTIQVKNTNDSPRNLTVSNLLINENLPKGTLICTLSSFDEDSNDSPFYSIIDADGGNFNLSGNRLYSGRSENFEIRNSYTIKLRVTDSGSPKMMIEKAFVVTVVDVNETPSSIAIKSDGGQLNFTTDFPKINEDARPGIAVGTVEVFDVDIYNGEKMTIVLDDSDGDRFRMATGSGVTCDSTTLPGYRSVCRAKIYVAKLLDYEANVNHTIIIRATDKGGRGLFKVVKFTVSVVNVNDAPTNIDLASGNPRVIENVNGAVVGELVIEDQDKLQTHKCELLDSANGRFVIVNREVRVSGIANLDYETHKSHNIRVKCTDNGTPALSVTKSFTVEVLDVNERPEKIYISNDQLRENPKIFTVVGRLTTTDPDNSHDTVQTFIYKLMDSANGRFRIEGDIVKVAVSNTQCLALGGKWCVLNFEEKSKYVIVVRVTDNGSPPLSMDQTVTIDLTDINDRPRNLDLSDNIVYENAPNGTVVGRFTASNEDAQQRLEYVLIDSENGKFEIVDNQLRKAFSADYETSKSHSALVTVRDDGRPSLNITRRFVIEVKDVNEPPFNISIVDDGGNQIFTKNEPRVRENVRINQTVGKIEILEYDRNDTVLFKLDDDCNGAFKLADGMTCETPTDVKTVNTRCFTSLLVARHLNFETADSHYVIIRAVDRSGLYAVARFKVEIVDINDVPANIELSRAVVNENLNDYLVGCFSTFDEDLTHNHTYTLPDDGQGRFAVKGRCLYTSLNASLSYEKQTEFNVTVRSTDDGVPPLFREERYLISVLDVNENPSAIALSNLKVSENSPTDTIVGVVSIDDPDNHGPKGVWQSHKCTVIDDARGRFVVKENILKVAVSDLDYEKNDTLGIVIRCIDSGSPPLFSDQSFTIIVQNVNEKPTKIVMQGGVSPENKEEHVVASFSTVDPDDENAVIEIFTYYLLNSDAALPFTMRGNQLVNTRMLNYELNPTWTVTVVSTDHGGLSITETFQVTVTDVNDPPSGIVLAGSHGVPENSVASTFVGLVDAVDEDINQTHICRLLTVEGSTTNSTISVSISQSPFSLDAQTCLVTVSRSASLDYETIPFYTLKIIAVDSGTPSYNYTGYVNVSIIDVNEQPTNVSLNGSEVNENSPSGTVVGTLFVLDPDNVNRNVQWHTCIVLRPYRTPFQVINNATLIVAEDTLDYEQAEFYDITIRCSDSGKPLLYIDRTFTIRVRDVNEAPIDVSLIRPEVGENLPPGSLAGVATCIDPDNEVCVFTLTTDGPFVLNGSDLLTTETLDYENRSSYVVTLTAADGGVPPLNTNVTIVVRVLDLNDPPVSIGMHSQGVPENSPINTTVGILWTKDEDCCQQYYYRLVPDNTTTTSLFRIIGNHLVLDESNGLNVEETQSYTLLIQSMDSGNPRITVQGVVTVYVLDVNEPPTDIISYKVSTIDENAAAGTFVANLTVIDSDFNQTHRCELLNGSEYFSIVNGHTPELFVSRGAEIDYEKNADIWVNIRCTDDGSPPLSVHHSFHVTVKDVNEPPTKIILGGKRVVPENVRADAVIGNFSVTDQDIGQSHSYKVVGQWASAFKVVKRRLVVANSTPIDYDLLRSKIINVTISVSDDGTPSYTYNQTFSFNITGVNEPPIHIQITGGGHIYENGSVGDEVGRLFSDNPERNDNVVYRILAVNGHNNSDEFYIIGTTLYLNTTLQYENISTYQLVILAFDDGIPPLQSKETVSVTVKATDPCALRTSGCHGNATCSRLDPDTAVCHCIAGFSGDGKDCNNVPECEVTRPDVMYDGDVDIPVTLCGNGGTCVDGIGNYTCLCPTGWTSRGCRQEIIECSSSPCMHGYCSDSIGRYSCSCYDGFTGKNCEENIDDCVDVPCGPGTCVDGINNFACLCPNSYEGYRCSFSVEVCRNNPCDPGLTCVPKPINPKGNKGFLTVNETSEPYCIPPYDISVIRIARGNTDNKELSNEFAHFVEKNLYYIPSSDPNSKDKFQLVRVSSVYIVQSEQVENDLVVHFVVLIDNKKENDDIPILTDYDAMVGLNYSCLLGDIDNKFCEEIPPRPTIVPVATRATIGSISSPQSASDYLWPVIGGLLLIAIVVGGGLVLLSRIRKKQLKRRARMDDEYRSMLPATELDHGGLMVTSPIYDGSSGLFAYTERRKDNPLYYESDDEEGMDYEHDDPNCFHGMSNPLFSAGKPALADGTASSNPLFAGPRDGNTPKIRQNPLYEEPSSINPIYERSENIYDEPQFSNGDN